MQNDTATWGPNWHFLLDGPPVPAADLDAAVAALLLQIMTEPHCPASDETTHPFQFAPPPDPLALDSSTADPP